MPVEGVAQKLLSALRKTKSKSALMDLPELFFQEGEERGAFVWLKDYVLTHNAWPTAQTFRLETGVSPVLVPEPLSYYSNSARERALWQMLTEPFGDIRKAMEQRKPDEVLAVMRQCMAAATQVNNRREGMTTLAQALLMVGEDYDIAKRTVGLRGIPTGWEFLDRATDGWQNSDLVSLVARTGRGKTQTMLNMLKAAHNNGNSALFFSGEMSVLALARRLFGLQTGVNPNFIRSGRLSTAAEREMRRQLVAMAETEVPLYWLAGNFKKTIPALKASIYEAEPDIVFLDAAYLLKPESKQKSSRREVIADVIEELAGLFKEIDRPGIISVQFNRQAVKPKKGEDEEASTNPLGHLSLEKIGETDVIGQSSSIVLFLEKGDAPHENTRRYMGIGKGREGEEGWMEFNYKFQPVNMSMIRDHRSARRADNDDAPQPDMSFMEA